MARAVRPEVAAYYPGQDVVLTRDGFYPQEGESDSAPYPQTHTAPNFWL